MSMPKTNTQANVLIILTIAIAALFLLPGALAMPGNREEVKRPVVQRQIMSPIERQNDILSILGPDTRVLDYTAIKALDEAEPTDELSMLVQFNEPFDKVLPDLDGFEVVYRFKFLNGATLKGTAAMFEELSNDPRLFWMEHDEPQELMMELSTMTINGSKVWDSQPMGENGLPNRVNGEGICCVVLDTGIDADHPDLDYKEKTIINLKANAPGGPWHERVNSDTSYGHGTHCAGTVAGNGDASAGARRGVAPESTLIGLSVGDVGITLTNVYGGLEWCYDNSRPGANPHNIKVVSNSWGGGADYYDPQDTLSQICEKLAHDNNVVCVFAAGNAGSNNHDGSTLTTSPTANTPINIAVAALERDGGGVAYFSSRGIADRNETWPDVGAPGVKIWSAHARKTQISAMQKVLGQNPNPYYLAISGTSMATPHVSGVACLMYQVCPSLTMSHLREDYSGNGNYDDWFNSSYARVHEVEWILEESTVFLQQNGDNGVPDFNEENMNGRIGKPMDFAQGYGLVMTDRAVGIAMTLESLRNRYPDLNITVRDAVDAYDRGEVLTKQMLTQDTDRIKAEFHGEYSRWNDVTQIGFEGQNQTCRMFVPEGATHLQFDMSYTPADMTELRAGDLSYTIDIGDDGTPDIIGDFSFTMMGTKHLERDISEGDTGKDWAITIVGRGLKVPLTAFNPDQSYVEIRVEYDASVVLTLDRAVPEHNLSVRKEAAQYIQFHFYDPSPSYSGTKTSMKYSVYEPSKGDFEQPPAAEEPSGGMEMWQILGILLILLAAAVAAAALLGYYYIRKKKEPSDA